MESTQQINQSKRGRKPKTTNIQPVNQETGDVSISEQQVPVKRVRAPRKPKTSVVQPEIAVANQLPINSNVSENWDKQQLSEGQWFCNHIYEKIVNMQPNVMNTTNQQGKPICIQGDWQSSYAKYYSADQFELEIPSTQTELAEIIQNAGYTVFTVSFNKKLDEKELIAKIQQLQQDSNSELDKCTKKQLEALFEGPISTIRGYLMSTEEHLGRATVINLDADLKNQFRLVDLRQIQFIIIRNIKYFLAKSRPKPVLGAIEQSLPNPCLNIDKLKIGDIVYSTQYLKVKTLYSDSAALVGDDDYKCEFSIMQRDMWSASLFSQQKKSTITEISQILQNAVTTCFTVCFNAKSQQVDIIKSICLKELTDPNEIASSILNGRECIVTCRLFDQTPKLGRSHVIELETKQHKQVDHRTIKWVIFKNIKYVI